MGGDRREAPDFEEGWWWYWQPAATVSMAAGAWLATGIGGGDAARRRGLHGGLGFVPWCSRALTHEAADGSQLRRRRCAQVGQGAAHAS
jgi:hypothetical protein